MVIINPAAGSGRAARAWARVRSDARGLFSLEEAVTRAPGDATELARQAAATGVLRILAVGGDGTLHELVNALAHTPVALGVLPCGTGNDFARTQGLMGPLSRLLPRLASGRVRRVDLGQVERTYYLNVAGVGFDAEIARRINARPHKAEGTLSYLTEAVRLAFRYEPPLLGLRLEDGSDLAPERLLLVAVGNASAYGGGMRICPDARVDDGLLDAMLAGDIRRWSTLGLLPRVFLGRHVGDPRIRVVRIRSLRVSGPPGVALHADGEIVGGLPATFRVHPAALRLWCPASEQAGGTH